MFTRFTAVELAAQEQALRNKQTSLFKALAGDAPAKKAAPQPAVVSMSRPPQKKEPEMQMHYNGTWPVIVMTSLITNVSPYDYHVGSAFVQPDGHLSRQILVSSDRWTLYVLDTKSRSTEGWTFSIVPDPSQDDITHLAWKFCSCKHDAEVVALLEKYIHWSLAYVRRIRFTH